MEGGREGGREGEKEREGGGEKEREGGIGILHTEIPLYSLCKERWREGGREGEKERGGGEKEREGGAHATDCSKGLILLVKNNFTSRRESISGIVLT